jgi:flagellar motor switch protein FliN
MPRDPKKEDKQASAELDEALTLKYSMEDLKISAQLQIGSTTLPLRSILNIKVGEVIPLDRPLSAPVQVIAGGRTVASGELVLLNGFFAVDIKEVSTLEMHLPAETLKY